MAAKNFLRAIKREIERFRDAVYHSFYISPKQEKDIVRRFHKLYYDSHIFGKSWEKTFWCGTQTQKCPLDLWIYQEVICELRPDVIIETGTFRGGSALFLASICELIDKGEVLAIDIEERQDRPQHKRINYLLGSSTSGEIVEKVRGLIKDKERVMVILDSDHRKGHVLNELRIYSNFVTKGSYLIVEDTNLNGHPADPSYGPGPMEAVGEFLGQDKDFAVDKTKEKFYLTFNPNGYLLKVR